VSSGVSVFLGQAVVGKDPPNASGADGEAELGSGISHLRQIAIGLETPADEKRLDLLGAF
jgi:hypothetical protein